MRQARPSLLPMGRGMRGNGVSGLETRGTTEGSCLHAVGSRFGEGQSGKTGEREDGV